MSKGWIAWAQEAGLADHAWTLPYWVKYSFDEVDTWYDDYIAGINDEAYSEPEQKKAVRDLVDEKMGRLRDSVVQRYVTEQCASRGKRFTAPCLWMRCVEQFALAVMALTDKSQMYIFQQSMLKRGLHHNLYDERPSTFQDFLKFFEFCVHARIFVARCMTLPSCHSDIQALCDGSQDGTLRPPSATERMYADLYGDGTTLLRDRLRNIMFHEILGERSPALTKGGSVVIDHCEVGAGLLRIAEKIHRDPNHRATGKAPDGHVCIVIWSGEGLVAEGEESIDQLAVRETKFKTRVVDFAIRLRAYQRYLVVTCQLAERFGQSPAWKTVMSKTRPLLDLMHVPNCDGLSLAHVDQLSSEERVGAQLTVLLLVYQ